jgi:hypothetical protein
MPLQPEQIVHINVVNWFNHHFPELEPDFHHFANERRCSIQQGKILKRMGVKRGVADFFLAFPQNGLSGLWLELKIGKNNPTKEQKAFLERKSSRGYEAICVWGQNEAIDIILDYLSEYLIIRDKNIRKNLFNGRPIC